MSRWPIPLFLLATTLAAQQAPAPKPATDKPDNVQLPPEEDKSDAPKVYAFNPLQSKKEVSVGEFYAKKGDMRAAAIRFREATKWDDGNAEAWLRLGETRRRTTISIPPAKPTANTSSCRPPRRTPGISRSVSAS